MSDTTSFGTMPSTSQPANGQEAEGLLNQLLDHTSNGVCCYDLEGRIRWVNPAFEQLLGYREQQVVGKVPSEFLMGPASDLLVITRLREQR
ncbi:PAS domain-containing protein, partial [Pseudoalteromonas sp. SIMBA_148]